MSGSILAAEFYKRMAAAVLLLPLLDGCGNNDPGSVDTPDQLRSSDRRLPEVVVHIHEPYRIDVTGRDYQWHVDYPGPDGESGTDDDVRSLRNIHIPLNTKIVLKLHSKDYIYSLALPEYDLREIAVPQLEFELKLRASAPGRFELRGNQMCGYSHPQLLGHLIVQERAEFEIWIREQVSFGQPRHSSSPPVDP